MVIRKRIRAILYPLLLYCVSGSIGGYFIWHATNGERGLKTKQEYEHKIALLETDLRELRAERARWEHKIELLRGEEIDRDLLDEEARRILGEAHKNDLVIFFSSPQ